MHSLEISPARMHAGEIEVTGFKHSAVLLMAASVLVPSTVTLDNVPEIDDVSGLADCISSLGGNVNRVGSHLAIDGRGISRSRIPEEISSRLHGPLYLVPTVLGRMSEVTFGHSGGCPIGDAKYGGLRPVRHVTGVLERFGARFKYFDRGFAGASEGFQPANVNIMDWSDDTLRLSGPLVSGATKTALLAAAAVARGQTVIRNPDMRSEVSQLISFLRAAGVCIVRDGEDLVISGTSKARPVHTKLTTDLIEVVTYIALAVYNGIPLRLVNITCAEVAEGLRRELALLGQMGVTVVFEDDSISVDSRIPVAAFDIELSAESIYSDSQPFFALMALHGDGVSRIRDHVWRNRFAYARELTKLGANLKVEGNTLTVFPSELHSEPCSVGAEDVRAAAVLTLAALSRNAPTRIEGAQHLGRGYDNFVSKLRSLGADIVEAGESM
jgi:UDP-N-acetylglucosamine 1-carboxyvinyltransferase